MNKIIKDLIVDLDLINNNICNNFITFISKLNLDRANASLINTLNIYYNNSSLSLNKLASVTVKDRYTLNVNVFDKKTLKYINQSILKLNLNLTTIIKSDHLIYVIFPKLNIERKILLNKVIKQKLLTFKINIRNNRHLFNKKINVLLKKNKINKDDLYFGKKAIQNSTDKFICNLEKFYKQKVLTLISV